MEKHSVSGYVSVSIAAERAGIPARTLRHACDHGLVPARRLGVRAWVIRQVDADYFAANRPKSGPKPKAKKALRRSKKSRKTT